MTVQVFTNVLILSSRNDITLLHHRYQSKHRSGLVGKFVHAYEKSVPSIGSIGAVLEKIFFSFGVFFTGLVFLETFGANPDASLFHSQNQGFVMGFVDLGIKVVSLADKGFIDHFVFFPVWHRLADVNRIDPPALFLKFILDGGGKIISVDRIVIANSCTIEIVDNFPGPVETVIFTEILNYFPEFTFIFYEKGVQGTHLHGNILTTYYPVDIGVVIECDANRPVKVQIPVLKAGFIL